MNTVTPEPVIYCGVGPSLATATAKVEDMPVGHSSYVVILKYLKGCKNKELQEFPFFNKNKVFTDKNKAFFADHSQRKC